MKKQLFKILFCLAFLASVFITKNANSQTAGTMTFNVTPVSHSGSYTLRHVAAVWVETASGTFVKTRARQGSSSNCSSHCIVWKAKSNQSVVDVTTAATLTTYVALTYTWLGNDLTGTTPYNLSADGDYKVGIEFAWDDSTTLGTGRDTVTVIWTKGPTTTTTTPANRTNFTGISVTWTPAAQNTTATSALASSTFCTGATVSVPFTNTGTTTVYANNTWTAQLSDASGSFATPTTIGTLTGAAVGTISATIPAGATAGTGYRIRVIGTQPATTGTDNGTDLAISSAPAAPTVGTITQPTCAVTTGSAVLTGLPATGTWTINPGAITGSGTSYTLTNLATGTYNYTVTSGCISPASANVVINAAPTAPTAPTVGTITQPTCSVATGSAVLNGLPATGTWTINPGAISGTGTSYTLTGLATGTYNYTVTNAAACTSVASANVVVNAAPTAPTAPTVGTITQPTCSVVTGSAVLNGLPATGTWTINPGNISGTGVTYTLTGLATGSYNYTVTNAAACTSVASSNVVINAAPSGPTAPAVGTITQPSCVLATGSANLTGLPATGTWTINPGNISGTGTTYTVTSLATGTYNYTVTDASACVSAASANVVINAQPIATAPTVGTITQPTCTLATGSVDLTGLPATGTWTINPGNITGTGTTHTITGLATGTHTFTVTNASSCTSVASSNVVINAQPSVPTAPTVGTITQPSCLVATGTAVLNGLPATGTWTINPGNISGTGTSTTLIDLLQGTYNYTVTTGAACTSVASANVVINAPPAGPPAPTVGTITQPTCVLATGSALLTGLPATGTWTINPGNISGTGTSYTVTGLATGTHTFTVTSTCASLPSSNIVINAQPATPSAPVVGTITQPTCVLATGSAVLTGLPATGTWTINPDSITGTGTSYTVTGLATGTHTFTVTNAATCSSVASSNVVVNAQPATPTAPTVGTITQPTCSVATGSAILNGLPATGTWTINPGNITGTGTTYTLSGLATGTYSYTVTNAATCVSVASSNVVIDAQPTTPSAPTVGTITQPTCTVATGSVILNGLPATGTWIINPGNISGTGTTYTLSGIAAGTYTYTVTNAATCVSVASANVVIDAQPSIPATPTVANNNNVLSSSATTGNQWYNQATGAISGATSQNFTVTANGSYYVIVTVGACSSDTSNIVTITNVGLESLRNNNSIKVYPNPVSNLLTIELNGNTVTTNFEILNSIGQEIFKGTILVKAVVQTSSFAPGVYVIKLDNGKTFEFKKIIKE
ncbi:MAG: T9SS type A sorting domain-containing protein [Bacteroidota bacterium]